MKSNVMKIDETLARITVELQDRRFVIESPYSDENILDTLLEMVAAISISATYSPDAVYESMIEYGKDRLGIKNDLLDEYDD